MKNIVKSLFILLGTIAISCSTDDVQDRPIIQGVDAPVLSAPEEGNIYVLLPENMTQQAERFVWSKANYNGDVAISYSVEIDNNGGDFSTAQVLGGTSGTLQASISTETLNTACLSLGATPYSASNFDVRVVSSANGYSPMVSNIVTITVTPYTTETPKLWMPGSYQADSGYGSNWTQSTAATLASEGFGNTNFEGYVYFATAQASPNDGFKFTDAPDWNNGIFGDDGSFSGTLTSPGDNIGVTPGYYRVNANTTNLTYNLTQTSWAIIGNATPGGWTTETPMTYDPNTKKWSVVATLTAQNAPNDGLKFRANNGWDINLGDSGADGTMEYGGDNIGTSAGTFLIELDLSNPRQYTYTLTPQ